jgi:predicted butyrate kinase (DUF1464 family)
MDDLNEIKKCIESMEKYHQIEILRILSTNKIKINENRSGVFVNLSLLNEDVLKKIKEYISYVKEQTCSLNQAEKEKEQYKSAFFGAAGGAAAAGGSLSNSINSLLFRN